MPTGLGYRLPGTRIEEIQQSKTVNLTTSQRLPVFIGVASPYILVKHEAVTRGTVGLSDSLGYTSCGIYDIVEVGSQRGLGDYIEGTHFNLSANKVLWTSAGVVTIGATYFVTYKYTRKYDAGNLTNPALNDYRYKEFTNFEDVVTDLGDDIPDHPLVMISKLALKYYNVPKIAVVQVYTNTQTGYSNALDLIKERDVQTVCVLTTNAAVRTLVISHVRERSLPDNGKYRMAWFGTAVGTALGDEADPTSIRGITAAIRNERCVVINTTRAKYYYNDPTTKEELYTVVDGQFIACALAAYRDSFVYPATTLLNRTVPGLELYSDDFDDYYSSYWLTQAGGSSVFIVDEVSGAIRVRDDLTTDNTTVERNNINIVTAKDYIAKDVAAQMDRTFRGQLILDRGSYQNTVKAYLASMFAAYKRASVIESVGTLRAECSTERRDTVNIFYSYNAIYTHKYTDGTYTLEV